jgi:hypothetical protein
VTTTNNPTQKADIARDHTQEAAQDAKARAADVGGHATEAAHDVASTAADQAQNVKQETVRQARNLVSEATGQLSSQAGSQTRRISGNLRDLGNELHQMAGAGADGGTASELAHQAAERAHQLAGYLEGREPTEILEDLRSYARRRPGAFLAGAAALGLVAGRVGRGVKDAGPTPSSGRASQDMASRGTAATRAQTAETFETPTAWETSPLADGSLISSTAPPPLTAPPGESEYESETILIPGHDDRTVDLTDDYQSSLVEPGDQGVTRR